MKKLNHLLSSSIGFLPDRLYCQITFFLKHKRFANLSLPFKFNDKLLLKKLTDRDPKLSMYVDKYDVREWVRDQIGEEYLVPIIGIYNSIEDVNFEDLPSRFALKVTNGSQNNLICSDKSKIDWEQKKKQIQKWLDFNYYKRTREWPYKNNANRIIIEEFLETGGESLYDYKFWCFNGKIEFVQIDIDRESNHKRDFYTQDFTEKINLKVTYPNSGLLLEKPANYDTMITIVEELANDFDYSRISV